MPNSMKLNGGAKCAVTSRIPDETGKILRLERKIKALETQNQRLETQNLLLNRELRSETELKYMFGLFILEDNLTCQFKDWHKKGRPEHTDSWKNECLRYIKENLLPNGIRELALKIETTK